MAEYKSAVEPGEDGVSSMAAVPPVMASTTVRARRKKEEAVRRLVADVQSSRTDKNLEGDAAAVAETHDWLVASTVAAALEKGLDRDLHAELVQEAKNNADRIGQVCHDHADAFLTSVAHVAALGDPCAEIERGLKDAHGELVQQTSSPMETANRHWLDARRSYARAKTLQVMVDACQLVAVQLERARKQANLGRPRAALDAVDQARTALTTPMESLFLGPDQDLWKATNLGQPDKDENSSKQPISKQEKKDKLINLEQTPFGTRAIVMLPKIENEVLMSAKRGLNKWFLLLKSGGEGSKIGRAVMRQCAYSMALGPGRLGLGGSLPPSYIWRAKTADNFIARLSQSGKVARAIRMGYWFDRDGPKEAEHLEKVDKEGVERRAEAIAAAFGWYRCWVENHELLVDPAEIDFDGSGSVSSSRGGLSGSRHGLAGSRHGIGGSRHGRGSRHGKKSLGFRATTSSRSQEYQTISSTLGGAATRSVQRSKWCDFLTPALLTDSSPSVKEEESALISLPESIHPVRRAELAFDLLGRSSEFVQYYEQNRFGDTKIVDGKEERKSFLSSLVGDDISIGNDRVFFAKTLPHLVASVVGFAAVEATLETGTFAEADDNDKSKASKNASKGATTAASRFRETSERYERALLQELGALVRSRALRSTLGELVRSSMLMSVFRSALKVVHTGSSTRRFDKDLLALDVDVLVTARKLAQDEQMKLTSAFVADDPKIPMLVADSLMKSSSFRGSTAPGVPEPEDHGLPFGLAQMIQTPSKMELDFQEQARTSYNRSPMDEAFTFSQSVPLVLRSVHSRTIACAAFALTQQELGQKFPDKPGSPAAGYVLDCIEECISTAAVAMKDSENVIEEGSVEKAVQVMANISALQRCLPRLFGTLFRGLCHVGLVRADEVEDSLSYAERTYKAADKSCDAQVGSTYSLVYEICRNRIDSHITVALEGFNWVCKTSRDMPNAYCEGLVGYLRSVFNSLGAMDEGSRAGLHFSCCGHVAERLVKLFSGKPGDTATFDDSSLPPITKIDAFGIKNMLLDCEELERFADTTGIPQLRDCFSELRTLTTIMLDKEMPMLMLPENISIRRRKYPILSLDKILNILEKYQGTGLGDKLMGGAGRSADFLFIEKKEVTQLIKIIKSQVIS